MLNVLVVGGAGYVGSHVLARLRSAGYRTTVFDNLSTGHAAAVGGARLIEGDILDGRALEGAFREESFDVVLHFAARCYVGESVARPSEYYENNVFGTFNLAKAMRNAGVRRLVFSSSCAVYGNPISTPISESHPREPVSPYGASKLMAERLLHDFGAAYGLRSISLRYFNAAGCSEDGRVGEKHDPETHLIPLVLREAMRVRNGGDPTETQLRVNGIDYETSDGTCVRDFVHVSDLASAHVAAVARIMDDTMEVTEAFNLGTQTGYSVLEVIESCRRVTGVPIRFLACNRRPGDPPVLVADSLAARAALRWKPSYGQLDPIVETAWRWLLTPAF